jgi:hypothetical protein
MNNLKSIPLFFFLAIAAPYSSGQITLQADLDKIFASNYKDYVISKGDNRPDFDRKNDHLDLFLISLHNGISTEEFKKKAGWSDEKLQSNIQFLIKKGWLGMINGSLSPTVFIASERDGEKLYEYAKPLAEAIAGSIAKDVASIKNKFRGKGLDKKYDFESLSFLILSDVLLDNWQIMEMESAFLKQENRPERHGKFYYAAMMEYSGKGYEPFRIYGNQYSYINDSTSLSIYGNNRIIANGRLKTDKVFRDSVISSSLKLTPELYNFFDEISADYKPKLLKILEEQRSYSMDVFRKTGYSDKIRFEEFFIWWYHFIYTSATNILAGEKILTIPAKGNFYYL